MATSTFVPPDLDASTFEAVEPLLRALLERPVHDAGELERWLVDRSELGAACSESAARLYINMTCHTDDAAAQQAYLNYIESVPPKIKPLAFELDKRQKSLCDKHDLDPRRYEVLERDTAADVDLFREENVPLETELDRLSQRYDQTIGAMMVSFEGQDRTLPQMAQYLERTERPVREGAWRAISQRRLQDAGTINEIFDHMIELRHSIARNAGFDDFVAYTFKSKHRFDYTPEHCRQFWRACEEVIVPFNRRLEERRTRQLGLDALRPWDLAVDPKGREPLRPFAGGADLVRKTRVAMNALDPRLGTMFDSLGDGTTARGVKDGAQLDLDSRKGKAPGGYQYMQDRSRKPFIFMNAAGLHRDVETMVHEAGHAFHSMFCVDEPLLHYRHAPIEFCEVASMSMELLTMPHWGVPGAFYANASDLARAQRQQLEGSISLLAWIATIDAFQQWIYTNPGHTRTQRTEQWLHLDETLGAGVSWDGLDAEREVVWQKQPHLFGAPLYYIEYGIAQLGALGLWLRSLEEGPSVAIDAYIKALSLGGSRPLPELFAAAGIEFDFGPSRVARLVERVEKELAKLPE
ncbi:MAG: M3 family oligoendopeptidase [Phycisphaerales bacterium]|jgi:oligoendopeptidase F|nr:M3 family oligoendopeptidase [Phycisphaerales bacterium]